MSVFILASPIRSFSLCCRYNLRLLNGILSGPSQAQHTGQSLQKKSHLNLDPQQPSTRIRFALLLSISAVVPLATVITVCSITKPLIQWQEWDLNPHGITANGF